MRNAMWVGGGITGMGEIPMLGVKEKGIAKVIRDIFRNGEQGFFYDPSDMEAMFQEAAGVNAVSASRQPVGLMIDKSKGLSLLPHSLQPALSLSGAGAAEIRPDNTFYIMRENAGDAGAINIPTSPNKWYKLVIEILSGNPISIRTGLGTNVLILQPSYGKFSLHVNMTSFDLLRFVNVSDKQESVFKIHSLDELKGNHVYQTTSASRPILQHTPILAPNLLPAYDFRTWGVTGAPSPLSDNSFTTPGNGGVETDILKPNTGYMLELDIENTSTINIYHGASRNTAVTSGTRRKVLVQATTDTGTSFYLRNASAGTTTVYSIKVQEIIGYRTDQNYLAFDGVDDKLITNLPAPLTNATVFRSVPGVGTQVKYNQTLPLLYEDSTNHSGLIAINRALTRSEQLRLMTELDKKAGATSLETLTFKAFDNNQEGFVYDPNDLSTLYQDATGTVPVTTAGQPVGLMLDKSKGLVLGNELSNYSEGFNSLAGISNAGTTLSLAGTALVVTAQAGTYRRAEIPISGLTVGKYYKIKFIARKNEIGGYQNFQQFTAFTKLPYLVNVLSATATEYSFILEATAVSGVLRAYASSAESVGAQMIVESVSVREVKGNHAYQVTSASRPILRKNAVTGANYLEFDGTDDFMVINDLKSMPESTIVTGNSVRATTGNHPILAKAMRGYLYLGISRASVQVVGESFYVNNNKDGDVQHVIYEKALSSGLQPTKLKTNLGESSANISDGLRVSGAAYLGRFSLTSGAYAAINMYGITVIGKALQNTEIEYLRKHYNKQLGVTLNV